MHAVDVQMVRISSHRYPSRESWAEVGRRGRRRRLCCVCQKKRNEEKRGEGDKKKQREREIGKKKGSLFYEEKPYLYDVSNVAISGDFVI